jgi:hypothetical protein
MSNFSRIPARSSVDCSVRGCTNPRDLRQIPSCAENTARQYLFQVFLSRACCSPQSSGIPFHVAGRNKPTPLSRMLMYQDLYRGGIIVDATDGPVCSPAVLRFF